MKIEEIYNIVFDACFTIHRQLGPGLLESAYRQILAYELRKRELKVEEEKPIPIKYDNIYLDCGYRIDLLVENELIVELKAVSQLLPIHKAQIITYMKLTDKNLGMLVNFNEVRIIDGIKRIVLNYNEND